LEVGGELKVQSDLPLDDEQMVTPSGASWMGRRRTLEVLSKKIFYY
jgi:hypothetical protein